MTTSNTEIQKKSPMDWIVRLLKGILVGIGFITPGLSGGVLAVVFGLYERLMRWLGNLKEQFLKNLLFFLPVGIGGVIGVVAFSAAVDWAFENYRVQAIWLFIGFIAGTFPSLLKTAGKEGRKYWHWLLLVFAAVGMFFLMRWMETIRSMEVAPLLQLAAFGCANRAGCSGAGYEPLKLPDLPGPVRKNDRWHQPAGPGRDDPIGAGRADLRFAVCQAGLMAV